MTKERERVYHYRGEIEQGTGTGYRKGYKWVRGYSENGSKPGSILYPWKSKTDCQAEAKRDGCRAVFVEDPTDAR